jgi:molecular chaperone GrpE
MADIPNESTTDDDEPVMIDDAFSIEIDDSILTEALAAVEKRMDGSRKKVAAEMGPIDFAELAAVESELAIEIEDGDGEAPGVDTRSVEARLRAMDAEAEAVDLRERLDGLNKNRNAIETQVHKLSAKVSKVNAKNQQAIQAQRHAEKKAAHLRDALEKQQKDVERLLGRRKKEKTEEYNRGKTAAVMVLAEVIDNLLLALSHDSASPEKIIDGVRMCVDQFEGSLGSLDVQSISPARGDAFLPALHEAIATEQDEEVPHGHITDVLSRGYQMDGKLLRAARVTVSGA